MHRCFFKILLPLLLFIPIAPALAFKGKPYQHQHELANYYGTLMVCAGITFLIASFIAFKQNNKNRECKTYLLTASILLTGFLVPKLADDLIESNYENAYKFNLAYNRFLKNEPGSEAAIDAALKAKDYAPIFFLVKPAERCLRSASPNRCRYSLKCLQKAEQLLSDPKIRATAIAHCLGAYKLGVDNEESLKTKLEDLKATLEFKLGNYTFDDANSLIQNKDFSNEDSRNKKSDPDAEDLLPVSNYDPIIFPQSELTSITNIIINSSVLIALIVGITKIIKGLLKRNLQKTMNGAIIFITAWIIAPFIILLLDLVR